ncbi:autoinducer binding domain-containing protein [Burkholderia ambifaria]|jgi:LuxR family transcriptional regulator|uniref:autoinducer binding domain-containing protein n=1 Tax=Burkholderia ambifaria TaxID=152480 RepID=UPI000CFE4949|nr:autoinducer binding domain-containing protein [Burkholderia ambifaria]PRG11394.1 LuxR family transcriptional regulator [Burkholderia ambifaria]UEP25644.1 autoinducer binding domain-containing protein [Burkholderia ambifaria]UEP52620.1 autoinducer binding domain-containing protein [Burkholderia ambifaria]WAS58707.1 autoinducer binding domain-containing protein [Burkholderia ambifaria]WDR98457.1 autoinducer binding domain-containing protein [Burkholderia ambifaria]
MTTLSRALSFDDVFEIVAAQARALDFEMCAYGARDPLPVTRPTFRTRNTYPESWQQRYLEGNYFARDPVVRYGLIYTSPLVWPVDACADESFWEEAKAHGVAHGWSQPIRDKHGRIAMWSVARSADPISDLELAATESRLIYLAHAAHAVNSRLVDAPAAAMQMGPFTTREKEVLKWAADGKTALEIASILSISERTITFHMQNIMEKLNSVNKTQAIVKAVLLGIIY